MELSFKEAREKLGYSIENVSNALKIRKHYIRLIEENQGEGNNLSAVYIRGYQKLYAEYLGIDLPREEIVPEEREQKVVIKYSYNHKKAILILSSILLLLTFASYSFIKNNFIVTDKNLTDKILDSQDHINNYESNGTKSESSY
jgi:cytoskeletal protein RodZ